MRCLSPRTVGFMPDGKTISWSQKTYSKEYASFQLPCGKCIECRLEYARNWAVRCVHESKMHEDNSFITLTYDDNHLKCPKLVYSDFQLFAKRLRYRLNGRPISIFVTGEYGDQTKRPHWHALIFNWRPNDLEFKYSNDRGDRVFTSPTLANLWGKGMSECGSVTFESAGYVARYAAKKLIHGPDGHEYEPISKKSSKHAIGKSFLEKYWPDIFNYGYIVLDNGQRTSIPRYYEKWLQKNQPDAWLDYITNVKQKKIDLAQSKAESLKDKTHETNEKRHWRKGFQISRSKVRSTIINKKFQQLQKFLKGDI